MRFLRTGYVVGAAFSSVHSLRVALKVLPIDFQSSKGEYSYFADIYPC